MKPESQGYSQRYHLCQQIFYFYFFLRDRAKVSDCIMFPSLQSDLRSNLGLLDGKIVKNETIIFEMKDMQNKLKVRLLI